MINPIEFKLFAPYNKAVSLIGSFSHWEEIPMEKNDQGNFKTQLELTDGVYQYNNIMTDLSEYEAKVFIWQ